MEQNGHTCEPLQFVTDLSLYRRFYADRELIGEDGKPIPYHIVVGHDSDWQDRPASFVGICPEAAHDRQAIMVSRNEEGQCDIRFCSLDEIRFEMISHPSLSLPNGKEMSLSPVEFSFLTVMINEYTHVMKHLTPQQVEVLPPSSFSHYQNLTGKHPNWEGRRTILLPGQHVPSIEGISFMVEGRSKTLDQIIGSASARTENVVPFSLRKENHR